MNEDAARARTAATAAALLVAQQVAGKAIRDGLFLQAFEATALPWALLGAASLSFAAVFAISSLVGRRGPAGTLRVLVALSAPLLVGEWLLVQHAPTAGAIAVYAHAALFGATMVSVFFSLVSESFDPWAARAAMARIGLGASLGGVGGGLLALMCSRLLPPADLLLAVAALQVGSLWAAADLGGGALPQPSSTAAAAAGLRLVRRSRYLRDLALFVALGAAIQALLDVPLSTAARARYAGSDLVTFFAAFHGASALLALVAQRYLASASLGAFGLAGTLAWRHAVVAAAAGLGAALPGLAAAAVARGGEALLSNSLFRSAYELLFTPLPESRKRPTKALVDVGCDKLGTALGGGTALVLLALLPASWAQRALFALAAVGACCALALCRRLHEGYVSELAQSLEQGLVTLSPEDARDSTTLYTLARATSSLRREELVRDLGVLNAQVASLPLGLPFGERLLADAAALLSSDPVAARAVLDREGPPLGAALVPLAIPLLDRNDLYLDALRALRRAAPIHAGALIDALLSPATPEAVRRRLPRALRGVDSPRAVPGLLMALLSTSFEVRYECGVALVRLVPEGVPLPLRDEDVHGLAARELLHLGPGRALDEPRRLEHVFHLLSLLHDRRALRSALWALRGGGALRGTSLEYLDNVLPDAVADPLFAALGTDRSRTERKEAAVLAEQLSRAAPAGEPED